MAPLHPLPLWPDTLTVSWMIIMMIITHQKNEPKRLTRLLLNSKDGIIFVQRYKKKLLLSVPKESLVENGILVQEYNYKKNKVCIKDCFLFFLSCFKELLSQFLGVACPIHNGSLKWSFYHEWIRYPYFTFLKFVILQLGFYMKWLETILLCTFLIRKKF